jgi:hypothetical protein
MAINVHQIVLGEALKHRPEDAHPVCLGIETDRAVGGSRKAMPKR